MHDILKKIESRLRSPGLIEKLAERLSGSELNSLLLELFRRRSTQISPAELLQHASQNRFTQPAPLSPIEYREEEIKWLETAAAAGFKPLQLSPVSPLGSCSAFGSVDQNNVVSASRNTEVVADATNMLAIQIARELRRHDAHDLVKICTAHRHVRAQYFTNPEFFAHFDAFCVASGGSISGKPDLEIRLLKDHLAFYCSMLSQTFLGDRISLDILLNRENPRISDAIVDLVQHRYPGIQLTFQPRDSGNAYYQVLQFRFNLDRAGKRENLADGGFVDWTQRMLENKKQRLVISGVGLERVLLLRQG